MEIRALHYLSEEGPAPLRLSQATSQIVVSGLSSMETGRFLRKTGSVPVFMRVKQPVP